MTSRDFCFWLQGFFELHQGSAVISEAQATQIRNHLNLVFKHEIDPSMPDPKGELQAEHDGVAADLGAAQAKIETLEKEVQAIKRRPTVSNNPVMRC